MRQFSILALAVLAISVVDANAFHFNGRAGWAGRGVQVNVINSGAAGGALGARGFRGDFGRGPVFNSGFRGGFYNAGRGFNYSRGFYGSGLGLASGYSGGSYGAYYAPPPVPAFPAPAVLGDPGACGVAGMPLSQQAGVLYQRITVTETHSAGPFGY